MVVTTVTNGSKTRDNMKISRVVRVTVPTREPRCTTGVRMARYLRKFVAKQFEFRREQ